jgi:hypothetical protein
MEHFVYIIIQLLCVFKKQCKAEKYNFYSNELWT